MSGPPQVPGIKFGTSGGTSFIQTPGGPQPQIRFGTSSGVTDVFAGTVTGLTNVPLAGALFEKGLTATGLVEPSTLERLAQEANSSMEGKAAALFAEIVPTFVGGGLVFKAGQKLAWAAGSKVAPLLLQRTMGGPEVARNLKAVAAFRQLHVERAAKLNPSLNTSMERFFGGHMEKQLADMLLMTSKVANVAGGTDDVAKAAELIGKPAVLRALEVMGTGIAFGTVEVGDALANEKPFIEALSDGAKFGLLAAGGEAAFTVAGKALFKNSRNVDDAVMFEKWEMSGGPEFIAKQRAAARKKRLHMQEVLGKAGSAKKHTPTTGMHHEMEIIKQEIRNSQYQKALYKGMHKDSDEILQGLTGEIRESKETLGTLRKKMHGVRKGIKVLSQKEKSLAEVDFQDISQIGKMQMHYLRTSPVSAGYWGKFDEGAHSLMLQVLETPEQLAKQMGTSTQLAMKQFQAAEAASNQVRSAVNLLLGDFEKAAVAAGHTVRPSYKTIIRHEATHPRLLALADEYRRNGAKGVKAMFPGMDDAVDTLDKVIRQRRSQLVAMGHVASGQKSDRWPLMLRDDMSESILNRNLIEWYKRAARKSGMTLTGSQLDDWATMRADRLVNPKTLKRQGSMETFVDDATEFSDDIATALGYEDVVTLMNHKKSPFIVDPLQAMQSWLNQTGRKIEYTRRLGVDNKLLNDLRNAARMEGTSIGLFNAMSDAILGKDYGTQHARRMAAYVTNAQTASKLPLAVTMNFVQGSNSILLSGLRDTAMGVRTALGVEFPRLAKPFNRSLSLGEQGRRTALHNAGIMDSLVGSWRESFLDPNSRTPMGQVADLVLWGSKFVKTERINRMISGAAGANHVMRMLPRAVAGKLRGNTLTAERHVFKTLGLDLDDLVRGARRAEKRSGSMSEAISKVLTAKNSEVISTAAWKGSLQTQFLPLRSRKPTMWDTPMGRVLFQFKTFSINQTRFLRDTVVSEAINGNMKPLAYFLSVYPVMGEISADVRSLFSDDPGRTEASGIDRALWNFSSMGGIGIVSDIVMAATYGRLAGWAFGPTVTDTIELFENIAQGDTLDAMWKRARREPSFRAGKGLLMVPLGATVAMTQAMQELLEDDATSGGDAIPLEDLR